MFKKIRYFRYLGAIPALMGIGARVEPYFDDKDFDQRRDIVDGITDIQNAVNKNPATFGPDKVNATFVAFEALVKLRALARYWQTGVLTKEDARVLAEFHNLDGELQPKQAVAAVFTLLNDLVSVAKVIDPSLKDIKALSFVGALPNLAKVYPLAENFFNDRNFDVRNELVDALGDLVGVFVKDFIVHEQTFVKRADVVLTLWELGIELDGLLDASKSRTKTAQIGVVLRAIRTQLLILRPGLEKFLTLEALQIIQNLLVSQD